MPVSTYWVIDRSKTLCNTEHLYFFQVLTGCEAAWVPAAGGQLPDGALPSGETEDGEPLFVGRASHEGTLTVGKVKMWTRVCVYCVRTCAHTPAQTVAWFQTSVYWTSWPGSNTLALYLVGAWLESQVGRYPSWGFSWFSSAPLGKWWDSTSIRPQPLLRGPFHFMSSYYPTPYSLHIENIVT
jgi:hypothetical protein